MGTKISLVGRKFGYLKVLEELPRQQNQRQVRYLCRCYCGNVIETTAASLRGGKKSCGCIVAKRKELRILEEEKARAEREIIKEKFRNIRIAERCKFRNNFCKLSKRGLCCHKCEEKATCPDMCLNTPEKCGLIENIKRAKAS